MLGFGINHSYIPCNSIPVYLIFSSIITRKACLCFPPGQMMMLLLTKWSSPVAIFAVLHIHTTLTYYYKVAQLLRRRTCASRFDLSMFYH